MHKVNNDLRFGPSEFFERPSPSSLFNDPYPTRLKAQVTNKPGGAFQGFYGTKVHRS